jgi:predicted ArsR family transcriptional regulator
MPTVSESADAEVLKLLRRSGSMSVGELAAAMAVTSTAVRQRLTRLMGQGLVGREPKRSGRGRPTHRYSLTELARRQLGHNFADLALVLWREIRAVANPEVRRGLLQRVAESMAALYRDQVVGRSLDERLLSLAALFGQRRVPLSIGSPATGGLPVLTVHDCPYPELAEQDRGICAVEKMLFSQLLNEDFKLSQCRLDGGDCCQFEMRGQANPEAAPVACA